VRVIWQMDREYGLDVTARLVLAQKRIGDDAVEALQLSGVAVHGMQQCMHELEIGTRYAMQKHVQLTDGRGRSNVHLTPRCTLIGSPLDCSMNSRLMMSVPRPLPRW
jgi:hypothetical protein